MLPRSAGRPLTFRIGGDPLRCSAWSPVPRSLRSLTRRRPRHAGAVTDLLGDPTLLRCADFARAESLAPRAPRARAGASSPSSCPCRGRGRSSTTPTSGPPRVTSPPPVSGCRRWSPTPPGHPRSAGCSRSSDLRARSAPTTQPSGCSPPRTRRALSPRWPPPSPVTQPPSTVCRPGALPTATEPGARCWSAPMASATRAAARRAPASPPPCRVSAPACARGGRATRAATASRRRRSSCPRGPRGPTSTSTRSSASSTARSTPGSRTATTGAARGSTGRRCRPPTAPRWAPPAGPGSTTRAGDGGRT